MLKFVRMPCFLPALPFFSPADVTAFVSHILAFTELWIVSAVLARNVFLFFFTEEQRECRCFVINKVKKKGF